MRKFPFRMLLVASLAGFVSSPDALAQSVPARKTVAVSPFGNNSGLARYEYLGKALADMLVTDLSKSAAIRVVERDRFQELVKELRLSESKFIDPKTAQRLGRGLGASHVMVGGFTMVNGTVRLDARVLRTETSEVAMAESVEGPFARFFELEKELGRLLLKGINVGLSPQEEAAFQRPVTRSLEALEQYGRALDARDRGEVLPAKQYLETATTLDSSFDRARQLLGDLDADIRRVVTREYTDRAITFMQRGRDREARAEIDRAIQINPRDGRAYFLKAVIAGDTVDSRETLADLDRAVANGHRTPKSLGFRGNLRMKLHDAEGAARDFEAALRVRGDPSIILKPGFDYDEPPAGDATVGRHIHSLGMALVEMGQPRRARRLCASGQRLVSAALLGGVDAGDVDELLKVGDGPVTTDERAVERSTLRGGSGAPDESWLLFCVGWATASQLERADDADLRSEAASWMVRFRDGCLTNNDLACRESSGLPGMARGLLHELTGQRPIAMSAITPIPGGECARLLGRVRDERLGRLSPSWTEVCVEELTAMADSLGATTADDRLATGTMRYFGIMSEAAIAVPWDEAPASVLQASLGTLALEQWRRGRKPEGCRWYGELTKRGMSTPKLDGAARTAGCARPSESLPVSAPSPIAYDVAVGKDTRGLMGPAVELLLDWLNDMSTNGDRFQQITMPPDGLGEITACRPFLIALSKNRLKWQTHIQAFANAAARGRFMIRITAAQAEKGPAGCPALLGFQEHDGGLLNAAGVLIWPPDARGTRRESALTMLLYRGPDGRDRITVTVME